MSALEKQLAEVIEAVLMFHGNGPWTAAKRARWLALTGREEATTKALCDYLRAVRAMLDT